MDHGSNRNKFQILGPHLYPEPPIWYHLVPTIILPAALLVPRTILSRWQNIAVFMPVITAVTLRAWWKMGGVDVLSVNGLLWALFLLVLKDPWRDFRYVRGSDGAKGRLDEYEEVGKQEVGTGLPAVTGHGEIKEQTTNRQTSNTPIVDDNHNDTELPQEQPYPLTLLPRIPWIYTLLISIRLNNWKTDSPSHNHTQPPAPAFPTHLAFALQALSSFTLGYVALDLTSGYISHDPYFHNPHVDLHSPLPNNHPPLVHHLPPRLVRTMIIGVQAWALIGQMFYLPCLLPLTLHYLGFLRDEWSPHNWPPYFGPPSTILINGVRGFWGRYWHQTMRWTVSAPGYAIADFLRLRKGGKDGGAGGGMARYAVITSTAFALSGLVHMGLVPPEPLNAIVSPHQLRFYVFAFFALQPIAMLLEVLFASAVAKSGGGGLERWNSGNGLRARMLLNAVWTIAWFASTLGLIGEMGRQLDWWHYWTVPVSLWKGLRGEGWIRWPVLAR